LDQTAGLSSPGDFSIPMVPPTPNSGVWILSPTFVNHNISLPTGAGFNSTLFTARVTFGDGGLTRASIPYKPASPGGQNDRYNFTLPGIYGLMQGSESDGKSDKGLTRLYTSTGMGAAPKTMADCLLYNTAMHDLVATRDSIGVVQSDGTPVVNNPSISMYYSLTKWNTFVPQAKLPRVNLFTIPFVVKSATSAVVTTATIAAIAKVTFTQGVNVSSTYVAAKEDVQFQTANPLAPYVSVKLLPGGEFPSSLGSPQPNQYKVVISAPTATAATLPLIGAFKISIEAMDVAHFDNQTRRKNAAWYLNPINNPVNPGDPPLQDSEGAQGPTARDLVLSINATAGGLSLLFPASPNPPASPAWTAANVAVDVDPLQDFWPPPVPYNNDFPTNTSLPGFPSNFDYAFTAKTCSAAVSMRGASFPVVDWNGPPSPFIDSTRVSWNFADAPVRDIYATPPKMLGWNYDYANPMDVAPGTPGGYDLVIDSTNWNTFMVKSIIGRCIVDSSTDWVIGFFVCDQLVIRPRNRPLQFIGTMIASQTDIDPSAVQHIIVFKSIYHPQSVMQLSQLGILHPFDTVSVPTPQCPRVTPLAKPVWQPQPATPDLVSQSECAPMYLRDKAEPFTWTTVDPDCGTTTGPFVECQHRPQRFMLKELSRRTNL
jgi:hypothetical protein